MRGCILSIGITNQRETTILWNKKTGKPIYNAIVWQDRRTANICSNLKKRSLEKSLEKKLVYLLTLIFRDKIKWIIENIKKSKINKRKELVIRNSRYLFNLEIDK